MESIGKSELLVSFITCFHGIQDIRVRSLHDIKIGLQFLATIFASMFACLDSVVSQYIQTVAVTKTVSISDVRNVLGALYFGCLSYELLLEH